MRRRPIVWLNAVLAFPAIVSLCAALRNAALPSTGQDFQWSGAHLVLHRIDPYRQYLEHDPHHLLIKVQVPNYLQELYVLLLPFGALDFTTAKLVWVLLNCSFAALVVLVLRRIFTLDRAQTLLLALLFVASTPFRIVIAAGQQTMLELLLFCLIFYSRNYVRRGIALGLTYIKYSFSPVLFLYLAFRRQYRVLAISLVPPVLGLFAFWLLVRGNILTLAYEPFAVSRTGVGQGLGDLMTLIHGVCDPILSAAFVLPLTYIAPLFASVAYAFYLSRQRSPSPQRDAAAMGVASLMFFVHETYDFIFLILPLAACLRGPIRRGQIYILSVVGLLWYAVKLIPVLPPSRAMQAFVPLAGFLLLSGILIVIDRCEFASFPTQQPEDLSTLTAAS